MLSKVPFKKRSPGAFGKIAKVLETFTVANRNELALLRTRTRTEAYRTPTASESALRALTTHLSPHALATYFATAYTQLETRVFPMMSDYSHIAAALTAAFF